MIPDIVNQAAAESNQFGFWAPALGVIIVFLGINMRVEIKIQKEEKFENKDWLSHSLLYIPDNNRFSSSRRLSNGFGFKTSNKLTTSIFNREKPNCKVLQFVWF